MAFHFSAIALAVAVLFQSTPAEKPWSPPIQADWKTVDQMPFKIVLAKVSDKVRFSQNFEAQMSILGTSGSAINDGAGLGRGVFIEVRDLRNRVIAPKIAMQIPPPLPPVEDSTLARPNSREPLMIKLNAPANTIFAKAGRYSIRAKLRVMRLGSPVIYREMASDFRTIEVLP